MMNSWRAAILLPGLMLSAPGCQEQPEEAAQQATATRGARRLSRAEYDATLRDLLGEGAPSGLGRLPEDVTDPFDNDAATQPVSAALVEGAEALAEQAAAFALATPARRAALLPCSPSGPGDGACLRAFIASFGRRALRRPLAEEEIERYASLQAFASESGDFFDAAQLVLRALLQDPAFLYRIEAGAPVPGADGVYRLSGYEVASRLSYFLLGTTPDEPLLDRAAAGGLDTPDGVRAAAEALLGTPRARARVERFHALWLGFHQLPHPAELSAALRSETSALLGRVLFDERADYLALFRAGETFLTPALATHYGLPAPPSAKGGWVPYGAGGRRGLLAHGAVLSAGAKFADTSPTQRGLWVRTRLLCEELGPPPPTVDKDNPPPGAASDCKLDRYRKHSEGGCAGCHRRLDPIGFGLEAYDSAGRFRAAEAGKPQCKIDGQGELDGVGAFSGPGALGELLISTGRLEPCLLRQVLRFALGRRDTAEDAPLLEALGARFRDSGRRFDQLLMDLAGSPAFGYRRDVTEGGG